MKTDGVDKRTARTKQVLSDAMFELLKNKKVCEITVNELCAKANINRGTFYKYYNNVQDVLTKTQDELYGKYEKLFSEVNALTNPDIFVYECLKLLKENSSLSRLLLAAQEYDFILKIHYMEYDSTIAYWKKQFDINDEELLDRIFTFITYGTFGLIKKWIENDFDVSPSELSGIINNMGYSCVNAFVK